MSERDPSTRGAPAAQAHGRDSTVITCTCSLPMEADPCRDPHYTHRLSSPACGAEQYARLPQPATITPAPLAKCGAARRIIVVSAPPLQFELVRAEVGGRQ